MGTVLVEVGARWCPFIRGVDFMTWSSHSNPVCNLLLVRSIMRQAKVSLPSITDELGDLVGEVLPAPHASMKKTRKRFNDK
jgi:hypothetical protein